MSDKSCTAYLLAKHGMGVTRLRCHFGADMESRDSAMCSALVNTDPNHFYFCYPDLAPQVNSTRPCLKCGNFCLKDFCSESCKSSYSVVIEQEKMYQKYFKQYRFAIV